MATEEYSIGYDAGYQDGWNAAMDENPKQEQGEPVAIVAWQVGGNTVRIIGDVKHGDLLYTTPQQRKPLTDEQIADIVIEMNGNEPPALFWKDLTRAIEAAHGIKE